jgi:hypothetical protein
MKRVRKEIEDRVEEIKKRTGELPTLDDLYPRSFTITGMFRIQRVGPAPKGEPRGRKPSDSSEPTDEGS